ncbi:MAG: hypothetical protein OXM03_02660 [Chloroflexota bacterium]|nr:hypothetical protein [Chloroflexota bacterium]MDE2839509.1 hypothetical protein [Chloroflexota bacterium]MDE2929898.1 hypothetical protein [Chloroflexota bacterium]
MHPGAQPLGIYLHDGGYHPRSAYVLEILAHAGIPFTRVDAATLPEALDTLKVLIVPHHEVTTPEMGRLYGFVTGGGALIGLGGTSGLDDLFGVRTQTGTHEAFLQVTQIDHPLVRDLHSSLHVWDAATARAAGTGELARLCDSNGNRIGVGVSVYRLQGGLSIFCAADLPWCILHMLQGKPVRQDGTPAPDGTAQTDDGILKCDDGVVLDWEKDRTTDTEVPFFLEAIGDELRAILLRSIFLGAQYTGIPLPMLWYWPAHLEAVAHLSHDSDNNVLDRAFQLLENTRALGVHSTWCIQYPGYTPELYAAVADYGSEICLHFDALSGKEPNRWDYGDLVFQCEYLRREAGLDVITSNKNHYTRWEGSLEFFGWLEKVGIAHDQSKGPSKHGNTGHLYGSTHPWFPMDPDSGRSYNVLEVNFLTQDMVNPAGQPDAPVDKYAPYAIAEPLVDRVKKHYGVAHYLFHPHHCRQPGVPAAMADVIEYALQQGLPWWTAREINAWERSRRKLTFGDVDNAGAVVHAGQQLEDATLLVLNARDQEREFHIDGKPTYARSVDRYGFRFHAVTHTLAAGEHSLRWGETG